MSDAFKFCVGDLFAFRVNGQKFGICQVLQKTDELLIGCIDWVGNKIPSLTEFQATTVLSLTHHNWSSEPAIAWVSEPLPDRFVHIGNRPVSQRAVDYRGARDGRWEFFRLQSQLQWNWDNPDLIEPPSEPVGRIILHRFNGVEIYEFESAEISAYNNDFGEVTLWFEVDSQPNAIQRCEDSQGMDSSPQATVALELRHLDVDQLVGQEFENPGTEDFEDQPSIYYHEHMPLVNNRIRVLAKTRNRFRIHWTGTTIDVNSLDESLPHTQVEIEGEFVFTDSQDWCCLDE